MANDLETRAVLTPSAVASDVAGIVGVVVVRFDEDGNIEYTVVGDTVRLFIVDERAPNDRIYEWLPRATPADFREIVPAGEQIGSNADDRHAAVSARVIAASAGRRHLRTAAPMDGEVRDNA